MFTPLSYEQIREANLAPAATVSVTTEYFKRFGVLFTRDEDDLDSFEFAAFSMDGRVVALLHYDHSPNPDITILLPEGTDVERGVSMLTQEFSLPPHAFLWSEPMLERYKYVA